MMSANRKTTQPCLLVVAFVGAALAILPCKEVRADFTDSYHVQSVLTSSASSTTAADGSTTTTRTSTSDSSESSDRGAHVQQSTTSTTNADGTRITTRDLYGEGIPPNATKIPLTGKTPAGGDHWQNNGDTATSHSVTKTAKDGTSTQHIVTSRTDKCGNRVERTIDKTFDASGKMTSRTETVVNSVEAKPNLPRAVELEYSGSYSFQGYTHSFGSYGSGWIGFKKTGATSLEGLGRVLGKVDLPSPPDLSPAVCTNGEPTQWIVAYAASAKEVITGYNALYLPIYAYDFIVRPTGSHDINYTVQCKAPSPTGDFITWSTDNHTADLLSEIKFQLPAKDGASYEYPFSGAATGSIKFTLRTNYCELTN